jgi:hypothetical protein
VNQLVISGTQGHGISGTRFSSFQEPKRWSSCRSESRIRASNLSNPESFGFFLTAGLLQESCRGAKFRELVPRFAGCVPSLRTGFANSEPKYLEKAPIPGLSGRAISDTLTAICGPAQYTNSAHPGASTQTWNQHRSGNPLQRLAFASAPIHETRHTDKSCEGPSTCDSRRAFKTVESSPNPRVTDRSTDDLGRFASPWHAKGRAA